mmetsp:Transcript_30423/g.55195  ORF Transcript_30423/g.55195 Transcript_30423/m.55195 type:complete len:89 (+) Transcript_30423:120-386(+)
MSFFIPIDQPPIQTISRMKQLAGMPLATIDITSTASHLTPGPSINPDSNRLINETAERTGESHPPPPPYSQTPAAQIPPRQSYSAAHA